MKKIAFAAALALASTSAFAGGMSVPVMEPEVVVMETAEGSSAGGYTIPLILLAIVAAAASSN